MKRIFFFIILGFFLSNCNRDKIELVFDKQPEERVKEKLDDLQARLIDAPYGWKASMNTAAGGGYGFYIDFNKDQTLNMLSDFSEMSSENLKKSTYRVTWTMNAVLMFDTYNYITMPQDPTPSVNGGLPGQGLRSDIEFEIFKSSTDTLLFRGKRYSQLLTLVKLTEIEQKAYLTGQYTESITAVDNYFNTYSNNYFQIPGMDNKFETLFLSSRMVLFQYLDTDGKVISEVGHFNYELDGVNFNSPVRIKDEVMLRGELRDGEFYLVNDKNMRYKMKQNASPILPIANLFAYNNSFNALFIGLSIPDGVNNDFTAIYGKVTDAFAAMSRPRHILQCYFKLINATKAELVIQSQVSPSGSRYTPGVASYNYTLDEYGVITLSNPSYDSNFTSRIVQLEPLRDYFLKGPFKLVYVESTDPTVNNLGGLQPLNDSNSIFYGSLKKL